MSHPPVSPSSRRPARSVRAVVLAVGLVASGGRLAAQAQPEPLASCVAPAVVADTAIERSSVYVPMRDGVRLAVDVYLPRHRAPGAKLPAVMVATRYWRAAQGQPIGPMERFWISRGYAYVYADVRGTGASFGQWLYPWSPQEIEDLGSVAAWIAKAPWSNGKVGSIGTSYTGNTAQLVAASGEPAIKAVVPRFMDFDAYADLTYPGGVVNEMLIRVWGKMVHAMDMNAVPDAPDGVRRVDEDRDGSLIAAAVRDHQGNPPLDESLVGIIYRDDVVPAFGGATNDAAGAYHLRERIERSKVPIFGWGSWLDAGTAQGVLNRFVTWTNPQLAVIGPWSHGGGHHASPFLPADAPTTPPSMVQHEQAACFFDHHLGDKPADRFDRKTLIYYTLGEEKWKRTSTWPIPGTKNRRLYLDRSGALADRRPAAATRDSYQVDFEVSTGQRNRWYTQLGGADVVYEERSAQDARTLTYTTAPLDRDVEVTGQGVITLQLASTATDGNFIVYLEDVAPDGKSTYVTEGMLRGLHRKLSRERPPYRTTYPYRTYVKKDGQPLVPGEVTTLTFQLLPTSVLFKAGHRIRIALAGADADTFLRTPATGPVTWTVELGGKSFIDLPVVP